MSCHRQTKPGRQSINRPFGKSCGISNIRSYRYSPSFIHIWQEHSYRTAGRNLFIRLHRHSNKPLGERSEFFAKLLSLSRTTGCIPFVFGENVINWDEETIKGYVFDNDDWHINEFPFPNVIYDRLPNRLTENRDGPKEVKQKFQKEYTIPWYNPGFFNKWDVNERLCADERALPYLPETYPFQSMSVVETLLSHYRQVYIKPIHGSLGLGIHQILYDKHENVYYCRYTNEAKENKLQKFSTLESIVKHIFHDRPLENLIVQQGIPLIRSEKRPVDFRVHTNKDSNGNGR